MRRVFTQKHGKAKLDFVCASILQFSACVFMRIRIEATVLMKTEEQNIPFSVIMMVIQKICK